MSLRSKSVSGVRVHAALSFFAVLSTTARAAGESWLPLQVGNLWRYTTDSGSLHEEMITGTIPLLGRTVFVKTYVGGLDNGLENYWQTGSDGSVLLAGFNNRPGQFALAYDPPIRLLATPPASGLAWATHATIYTLPDLTPGSGLDLYWSVLEDVQLDVPAGSYPSFGVGQVPPFSAVRSDPAAQSVSQYTIDGRRVPPGAATNASPTDWYSAGIGVVQWSTGEVHRLVTFENPTPVARFSWGRLKRLYHQAARSLRVGGASAAIANCRAVTTFART